MPSRFILLVIPSFFLIGCTDPMDGRDGISPYAGYAQKWNKRIHTSGITADTRLHPNPGEYGPRGQRTIEQYREGVEGPAADESL